MVDIDNPAWVQTVTQAETANAEATVNEVFFGRVRLSSEAFVRFRRAALMLLLLGRDDVISNTVSKMHDEVLGVPRFPKETPQFNPSDLPKASAIASSLQRCLEAMGAIPYDGSLMPRLENLQLSHSTSEVTKSSSSKLCSAEEDNSLKKRL